MLKYKKKQRFLKRGSKISLGALIVLEVAAIMVGVMLGFGMNEWRENRQNKEIAERALESVASEMASNHIRIVQVFDYYHGIVQQIDSLRSETGNDWQDMYGYQLRDWTGAAPPMLRSYSYQTMLSTGVVKDIPFETANSLAGIYNLQLLVENLDQSAIDSFIRDSGFAALPTIRHMFDLYVQILPGLMGYYQEYGVPALKDFGYHLALQDGTLKDVVTEQMKSLETFDLQDYN